MFNVAGYALQAEESFTNRPITPGDALVFSSIAYDSLPVDTVLLPGSPVDFADKDCSAIIRSCSISKRFSEIKILRQKTYFSNKPHCQFSGTAILANETLFIAFKGTDESVSGWLEDFDIISEKELPSQRYGIEFLEEIASDYKDYPIFLGGHSKGGNIATYAAAFCIDSIKPRIKKIYSFDGPGFLPEIRGCKKYKETIPKVEKYVPRMSFFGMMLLGNDSAIPVKCRKFWFLQHDHYAWKIDREGNLVYRKKLNYLATKTKKLFEKIINCLSPEERRLFVDIAEKTLVYAEVSSMYQMSMKSICKIVFYLFSRKDKTEKRFLRWLKNELLLGIFFPVR